MDGMRTPWPALETRMSGLWRCVVEMAAKRAVIWSVEEMSTWWEEMVWLVEEEGAPLVVEDWREEMRVSTAALFLE
jgi:hypothetical protein